MSSVSIIPGTIKPLGSSHIASPAAPVPQPTPIAGPGTTPGGPPAAAGSGILPGTVKPLGTTPAAQQTNPAAPASQPAGQTWWDQHKQEPIKDFHGLLDAIDNAPSWTQWVPGINTVHEAAGGMGEMGTTIQGAMNLGRRVMGLAPKEHPTGGNDVTGQLAAHPTTNAHQSEGATMENLGEFFGGDELLGLLGKASKILPLAEQLKNATGLAQMLGKYPLVAKLMNIGIASARQATVAGAQTFVRTNDAGDAAGAAIGTGLTTAALGGAGALATREVKAGLPKPGRMIEGVEVPQEKATPPNPAQAAGAEAFGRAAGESIRPDLERVNQAGKRPVMMNQPGGAPAIATGATGHVGPVPEININETLNRVGDYTRARQELADSLNGATSNIDQASGGEFKRLQLEVGAARDHSYASGTPEAEQAYRQKLGEMQGVIAKTPGMTPEMRDAISAGWRHYYVMGDVTRGLDKALMGLPGDSAISQTQRGIQGKPLLSELSRVIRTHTRAVVEQALGGAERLQSLEQIGSATQTNAGRKGVNAAMREVARWFPVYAGGALGFYATGGPGGAITGATIAKTAAEVGPEAYAAVRNAVLSNPKVAKNLLYAAQYGAKPENYGPFIATMIRQQLEEGEKQNEPSEVR